MLTGHCEICRLVVHINQFTINLILKLKIENQSQRSKRFTFELSPKLTPNS